MTATEQGDAKQTRVELAASARADVKTPSEWRAANCSAADAPISKWKAISRELLGRDRQRHVNAIDAR